MHQLFCLESFDKMSQYVKLLENQFSTKIKNDQPNSCKAIKDDAQNYYNNYVQASLGDNSAYYSNQMTSLLNELMSTIDQKIDLKK